MTYRIVKHVYDFDEDRNNYSFLRTETDIDYKALENDIQHLKRKNAELEEEIKRLKQKYY